VTDAIPLDRIMIINSPDIHSWPVTAEITKLDLAPEGAHVDFTKKDGPGRWPDVPFGNEGGSIQYTLWLVRQIASSWWAAGGIEFWYGLDRNGGEPGRYGHNWFYDPNRWTPLANNEAVIGELVGMLVTSGDARFGSAGVGVQERSNIVTFPFPPNTGGVFTFGTSIPEPTPLPTPPPEPPPSVPPPAPGPDFSAMIVALTSRVGALETRVDAQAAALGALEETAKNLQSALRLLRGVFGGTLGG